MTESKIETAPEAEETASGVAENQVLNKSANLEDTMIITVRLPNGEASRIPLVRASETVLNLKQLILDMPEFCHISSCHLEAILSSNKKKKTQTVPLDDHKMLEECPELVQGACVKVVPDAYSYQGVIEHVKRLKHIITNPPVPFLEDNLEEIEAEIEPLSQTENGIMEEKARLASKSESPEEVRAETIPTNVAETEVEAEGEKKNIAADEEKLQAERKAQIARQMEVLKKLKEEIIPIPVEISAFYPGDEQDRLSLNADTHSGVQWKEDPFPVCFRSLTFSGWNPPPRQRALMGDLAYLQVNTAETNAVLHITATARGFYINATRHDAFHPEPSHNPCHSQTLVELLQKASPSFKRNYAALLHKAAKNAKEVGRTTALNDYDIVTLGFTAKSEAALNEQGLEQHQWLKAPQNQNPVHSYDVGRSCENIHNGYGIVGVERGMLRDWNDDYQSCVEMPCNTIEEKIVRSRAIDRVQKDFVDAATKAVQGILEGHIPPINPADPPHAHVFVYNQIFFSLAKLETQPSEKDIVGGDMSGVPHPVESAVASYSVSNHDLQGVKSLNESMEAMRARAALSNQNHATENENPEDNSEADESPGLHTLATTIVDYLGQRVIAQSIIPGILQSDHNQLLVYGSVDYGKTIVSDPNIETIWKRAVQPWFIGESRVKEGDETKSLYSPVESKGIKGSDGRVYALDLLRLTPFDLNFYEKRHSEFSNKEGEIEVGINSSSSYVALLRPELIQLYARYREFSNQQKQINAYREKLREEQKQRDENKSKKEEGGEREADSKSDEKNAPEEIKIKIEPIEPLKLDLNVFTAYEQPDGEDKDSARTFVKELAAYLKEIRIPQLVDDIRKCNIPIADGKTLSQAMHSNGINMRYLPEIAERSLAAENVITPSGTTLLPPMPQSIYELCEIEMISRSIKWILRKARRDIVDLQQTPALFLASVLNDVFLNSVKTWEEINELVKKHYANFQIKIWGPSATMAARAYPLVLLRRICQVSGIVVNARDYNFGPHKSTGTIKQEPIFLPSDIVDVVPVVKSSVPEWPMPEARDCLETAKVHLAQKDFVKAYERANEALSLVTQVTGSAHLTVATCCSFIGTILHHLNDPESALVNQKRALALLDRMAVLDTAQVAHAHNNVGMLIHYIGHTDEAIPYLRRSLFLLELMGGPNHAEASTLYLKMATVYTQAGHSAMAVKSLMEALKRAQNDHLQQALCRRSLAHIFATHGYRFQEAFNQEKMAYDIYKQLLGPKHPRTQEIAKWMEVYLRQSVNQKKAQQLTSSKQEVVTDKLSSSKSTSKTKNKKSKNKNKKRR